MKRLKRFWRENSVLLVLLLILIACLVAITIVVMTYFVGDSGSKYGDRLDGIDKYPFAEKDQSDIISKMEADSLVENAVIRLSGKTIYITMDFVSKATLVEAQGKALAALKYFSDDVLGFYDLEFLLKADATDNSEGFQIIGSHNVNGTGGIVWNNNKKVLDDKEE